MELKSIDQKIENIPDFPDYIDFILDFYYE
jgi:hypothetical protein